MNFDYEDYPDSANVLQLQQEETFSEVVNISQRFGDKAFILRMKSTEAASILLDNSLDFCYIDAQHGIY